MSLLEVTDLHHVFHRGGKPPVYAVNGVSFQVEAGETLALIGESGSGKSTVGRLVLGLLTPTGGEVRFEGRSIAGLGRKESRDLRAKLQVVFQEPYESLNPRMRVGTIIEEPLRIHDPKMPAEQRRRRIVETLAAVGLGEEFLDRYPRQLSGGQQQRVGIARAVVTRPSLVVLDEPTSSLDVSVRARTLQLLGELQRDLGIGYVFISHDIHTVSHFSRRVAVMYLGRVVETGPTAEVLANPRHPYTRALLSAALSVDPNSRRVHVPLRGEIPSPTRLPAGCPLAGRCPIEQPECATTAVAHEQVGPAHTAACLNLEGRPSPLGPGEALEPVGEPR
ncbi:oligopeptide/dipeptide ABC transporter ATP-binding protein [Dactylosporangium salmoneum]|uniref:Dipeptide ABC transporter ATP-binding protein n=1 Tax=Dactylosporangium salmoneum TaxID=53361 RepID=A0ABP5TEU0_9ACTN